MFEATKLPQNIWHHSSIHAVPHPTRMETATELLEMTVNFTTLINQIKILQKNTYVIVEINDKFQIMSKNAMPL